MGSYENDIMRSLTYALREVAGIKDTVSEFNTNIETFEKIAFELERANTLKELELGLISPKEYTDKRTEQFYSHKKRK